MGLHNGRMRDLQFTCLLHIHKGGGSELFSYGQSNSYMVSTEQVGLGVQGEGDGEVEGRKEGNEGSVRCQMSSCTPLTHPPAGCTYPLIT